jgi:hypothetical protein
MDSENALVKGGLAYGIMDKKVASRISGHHYLVNSLQPFQPQRHPDYYHVTWADLRPRCKYTYETVIEKGEQVRFGEARKLSIEKFITPGEPLIFEDKIYKCDYDHCPDFVIDPSELLLSSSISDLSNIGMS